MEWEQRVGRRLKLRDLQTLAAVCRAGSMAKAAVELAMSQAAVSKALQEMERSLGFPVLERSSKGVCATAAGQVLLDRSRVVFDEIAEGLREIHALADPGKGQVRVGTTEAMIGFVTGVVDSLVRTYPGITLDFALGDTAGLIAQLRNRDLDVVITRLLPAEPADDLTTEMLFREELVVLCSKEHPAARRRRVGLADLMDERWTLSPPELPLGRLVARVFAEKGLPLPSGVVTTVSIFLRLNLLHTAHFVTMLPRSTALQPLVRSWVKVLPVDLPAPPGSIALLRLAHRKPSGALETFWRAAVQSVST